ncbi:MAG: DNA polymerase IV [Firmicutes bacterium]|nr:DNA polymerase IV [Bacillota bacterium]MBQ3964579.1 DNA polymerase IV [Bacillota bacterium]
MIMSIIMHVDANSAYLSWTAVHLLEQGYPVDLRTVPAVIAGDPANRHGIILAKSIPAKKYGIGTANSLMEARQKCPSLIVQPPDYDLYLHCSDAMYEILSRYSDRIQRYSVDECFLDYTASEKVFGDPVETAHQIRETIHRELGFTVNIGVSSNKLLAKMGSELEKPDRVHTLFPSEIREKMWPLPVGELFMVGRATTKKLRRINITTIGDLAQADPRHMHSLLKSHGDLVWRYANGLDDAPVIPNDRIIQKGVGNGITMRYDAASEEEAFPVILSLCERVGMRLRRLGCRASLIAIHLRTADLSGWYSHQRQMDTYTRSTTVLYKWACRLFREGWRGTPIRQISVSVSELLDARMHQISIYDFQTLEKEDALSDTVDQIRKEFGERSIVRGVFVNTPMAPIDGGVNDGDYIMMGGYRNEDLG